MAKWSFRGRMGFRSLFSYFRLGSRGDPAKIFPTQRRKDTVVASLFDNGQKERRRPDYSENDKHRQNSVQCGSLRS